MGIYRQATAPAYEAGGLWFDSDDNDKPYYGDGGSWVALNAGTLFADFSDTDHVQDADIFVGQRGAGGVNLTGSQFFAVSSLGYYHAKPKNTAVGAYNLIIEGAQGGYGAGISFQSKLIGSGSYAEMAKITADGENSWTDTPSTQSAGLRISIRYQGSLVERVRINNAGSVGIGTPTPGTKFVVSNGTKGLEFNPDGAIADGPYIQAYNRTTSEYVPVTHYASQHTWYSGATRVLDIIGGSFCYGRNAVFGGFGNETETGFSFANGVNGYMAVNIAGTNGALYISRRAAASTILVSFATELTQTGSITTNGTTTTYNTTSDYRLKDDVAPLDGSGAFIDALKPCKWRWKEKGTPGAGFIAHEFAEVSPSSVSGKKDATINRIVTDEETGEEKTIIVPDFQSMQASSPEVMANIIAELQSLRRRVAELEARQ